MIRKGLLLLATAFMGLSASAQDPMLTNWWFNTTNNMYSGILTDVEAVYYTSTNVYVKTSGVPNYYQHGVSVNDAVDLDAVWVIPRVPVPATTITPGPGGGQTGLMLDGSVCFHPGDAQSYNNANVWFRLAYYFEGQDMDNYNGHSTPNDQIYHHHFDNLALNNTGSSVHSPIVGFAWDGYPIYGSYAYANTDGTGGITRMKTSYQKYTYTTRTNGPNVNTQYPIGCFIEDWHYVSGSGDLDEHNGRFAITPEYPSGTYAYYTTIDASGNPEYPYFIGPSYYGVFSNTNLGPNGGNATIPGTATQYNPTNVKQVEAIESMFKVFPVPVTDLLNVEPEHAGKYEATIYDAKGAVLLKKSFEQAEKLNMAEFPYGMYFIQVNDMNSNSGFVKRIVKQ
jgi:hypothetical protein